MRFLPTFGLLLFGLLLSSCGGFQKMAVGTTAGLLYEASYEMETEPNFEHLKSAIPANLKMVEGLYSLSPNDDDLLVALIKGYTAYAFAIHETEGLTASLQGKNSKSLDDARHFYSRAIDYGLQYLKEEGIEWNELVRSPREEGGVVALLDKHLPSNKRALEGAAFLGQAIGGLINLKKDDMALVAQLPIAKGLFDWACGEDPNLNHGACDMFYGAYEAGRPRMLGGNPDKGREIFKAAIEKNPHNWLARITYIQYYVIPMGEEEEWDEQKKHLEKAIKLSKEDLIWQPGSERNAAFSDRSIRAFQTVALKRYEILKTFEKELF